MNRRGSGILCHITSLPSSYGIGDLGPAAYRFADFLCQSGQSYWQILPLTPTDPEFDNSPYHSVSAFAVNPLLISPDLLMEEGLLDREDVDPAPSFDPGKVDYEAVIEFKSRLFEKAFHNFKKNSSQGEFHSFCAQDQSWLEDFALFRVLQSQFQGHTWKDWPSEIKNRDSGTLRNLKEKFRENMEKEKFLQFMFLRQWKALKDYCHQKMVHIIGDIPIYVDYHSVDVWSHPELFKLDENQKPRAVAGVPPDYFSKTGQLWGNPLYDWDRHRKNGYKWWLDRIGHNLTLYDLTRIDHFRGFVGYWEVPASEKTAMNGKWMEAPAVDFFSRAGQRFHCLPIIAEDLGVITPDVREVVRLFDFPGMKVLLFAFGEDFSMHPYLPHTYEKNCAAYTGTHDTNTVRGWFANEASEEDKERLFKYLGRRVDEDQVHWAFIRLALSSVANTAIIPLQDILGLGEEDRMNRPACGKGNWKWRVSPQQFQKISSQELLKMTQTYGRA